jgi:hypothetical protein
MNSVLRTASTALVCVCLLGAVERLQSLRATETGCRAGAKDTNPQPSPNEIRFPIDDRPRFIMRRLRGPDGATDLRILGETGAPAILSLIGAHPARYSDFTYNGSDADLDVSHGGLNLRPLDGSGAVNVWSMLGNTRLRVGSRDFRQSLDFWHSGTNAYIRLTLGSVIVQSPLETRSAAVLGGDTFITGILRTPLTTPGSNSSPCTAGQIVWDADYMYVCTAANVWKRAQLVAY